MWGAAPAVPIGDLLTRTKALTTRYERYAAANKADGAAASGDGNGKADAFEALCAEFGATLEGLREKAVAAEGEKSRATVATLNAEIRRGKQALRTQLPRLEKLAAKKAKGLSPEEVEALNARVDEVSHAIEDVPDGVHRHGGTAERARKGKATAAEGSGHIEINLDEFATSENPVYNMEHTDQSRTFRSEFEDAKRRQDEGLDEISQGLGVLKSIAGNMGDEMKKQDPLIATMEHKTDVVNKDLRTANTKLKQLVTRLRPSRNMCVDLTCIIILLSISLYIYNILS